jgi:hypothetical protein
MYLTLSEIAHVKLVYWFYRNWLSKAVHKVYTCGGSPFWGICKLRCYLSLFTVLIFVLGISKTAGACASIREVGTNLCK